MLKLNLGCGKQHVAGYTNIDISPECKPDIQHDIREAFDLPNDSVDEVMANGVMEMLASNQEFVFTMNEIWRMLKPGGLFRGQVPSIDPRVLMLDPFDRRWFKEQTFDYWNVNANAYSEFGVQYGFRPWRILSVKTNENGIINFEMQKPA